VTNISVHIFKLFLLFMWKTLSSLDHFLVSVSDVKKTVAGRKRWKSLNISHANCNYL